LWLGKESIKRKIQKRREREASRREEGSMALARGKNRCISLFAFAKMQVGLGTSS